MEEVKIYLIAESENAAIPYSKALKALLTDVSKRVLINVVLLPDSIKEAKGSPMEEWDTAVADIINDTIHNSDIGQDDVVVICSNDLSIVTEDVIMDTKARLVDLNTANYASMLEYNEMMSSAEIKTVGVLATKRLMNTFYVAEGLEEQELNLILPSEESQDKLNDVIYGPLINNEMTEEDEAVLSGILCELKEAGADAIVSSCRLISVYLEEAGLVGIYDDKEFVEPLDNSPVPWIDSTKSVANKAVKLICS
jgi:aspartate/glutamate racemase